MIKIADLYNLEHTCCKEYLRMFHYPWQALSGIDNMIHKIGFSLPVTEFFQVSENVWIHKTAIIAASAWIEGPTIICAETEVRHNAYIRRNALVGERCVIGNSVELKNAVLFDDVQVPHYNYVGDSILGYKVHMGAGAVTSNVKSDKTPVVIHTKPKIETGMKKVGAMLGDGVEIGCNSVLNPGTVIGKNTTVYPGCCVRGVIPADSIYKGSGIVINKMSRRL